MILNSFILKEGYRSPECAFDERRVSHKKLCTLVCCCDLQGHSNGKGMSLVLASLSSAFYTSISKICDTKSCEWCLRAHLASSWL